MESDAYEAEDGHGEADASGWHAETACEGEGEVLGCVCCGDGMGWVEARGREEYVPETVESPEVESQRGMTEEGEENVAGPDAPEGEFALLPG